MNKALFLLLACLLSVGCARVKVEGSKEPIKMDISMRLDIYQHVEKDINAIEDIVSGSSGSAVAGKQGFLNVLMPGAYAEETSLSPEIEGAALRRKGRFNALTVLESSGVVGENKQGLVQVYKKDGLNADTEKLVREENLDRMAIYRSMAEQNKVSVEEIQRMFAKRLQERAANGTPIEVFNDLTKKFEWHIK